MDLKEYVGKVKKELEESGVENVVVNVGVNDSMELDEESENRLTLTLKIGKMF